MGRRPRLGYPISPPHTGRAYSGWQRLVPLLSLTVTAQLSSPKVNGSQCRTPSSRIAQIQIKPSVRTQSQCHTLDTAQDHATFKLASHSAFTSAGRAVLVGVLVVLHPGSPSWKAETINTAIGSVGPIEWERCPLGGCTQSTPQKSLSNLGFFKRLLSCMLQLFPLLQSLF